MSYVALYGVTAKGNVFHHDDARNNHGGAPLIWEALGKKYSYLEAGGYIFSDPGLKKMWSCWPDPKMSRAEQILLGATFDRVWVRREVAKELADALEGFYQEYVKPRDYVATTLELAKLIRELLSELPDFIGVAFNMCSANEPFWSVEVGTEEGPGSRPYNVLTDTMQPGGQYEGKSAWELSAKLLTKAEVREVAELG